LLDHCRLERQLDLRLGHHGFGLHLLTRSAAASLCRWRVWYHHSKCGLSYLRHRHLTSRPQPQATLDHLELQAVAGLKTQLFA
jgi:hypothetical protein